MRGNHKDAINSNEHLRAVRAYHVKKLHGFNKISVCEQTHASLPCVNRDSWRPEERPVRADSHEEHRPVCKPTQRAGWQRGVTALSSTLTRGHLLWHPPLESGGLLLQWYPILKGISPL